MPWMMFLNGKYHTHFAGAWTILSQSSSSSRCPAFELPLIAVASFTFSKTCTRSVSSLVSQLLIVSEQSTRSQATRIASDCLRCTSPLPMVTGW